MSTSPFSTKRPSRRQRREAAERARARREALEAAALANAATDSVPGAWGGPGAPLRRSTGRDDDYVVSDWAPVEPRWLPRFAGVVGCALVALFLAVFEGAPVYSGRWHLLWFVPALVAAGASGYFAAVYAHRCTRRRGVRIVSAIAVVLVLFSFVGLFTTTSINGRAYFNFSTTARVYHLALKMRSDLYTLASYDSLLKDNQAEARAAYNQYGPAATKLEQISTYYANLAQHPKSLPSPQFAQIAQEISDAGYWGSKALSAKANDIVQPDAANEANIKSWAQTYSADVLTAGPQLVQLAALYQIPLAGAGGPHE